MPCAHKEGAAYFVNLKEDDAVYFEIRDQTLKEVWVGSSLRGKAIGYECHGCGKRFTFAWNSKVKWQARVAETLLDALNWCG